MSADGSIIIETRLDNEPLEKDLEAAKKEIKNLEKSLSDMQKKADSAAKSRDRLYSKYERENAKYVSAQGKLSGFQEAQSHFIAQENEIRTQLEAAKQQVKSFEEQWKSGVIGADKEQVSAQENVRRLSEEYKNVLRQIEKMDPAILKATSDVDAQKAQLDEAKRSWSNAKHEARNLSMEVEKVEKSLDSAKREAGEIQQKISASEMDAEKMAKATEKTKKHAQGFATQLKYAMSHMILYGGLFQIFSGLTQWLGKVIKVNDEASAAVARLKGALLTLAQPLLNVIIPAFSTFVNILASMVSSVSAFLSALFGSTQEQAANQAEALEATGSAAKKAGKSLASFDEINKLSSGASGSEAASDVIQPDFSEAGDLSWLETTLGKAAGWVTAALMLGGIALVAIGAATGRLSLVLVGLLMIGSSVAIGEETGVFADWAATLGLESAEQFAPAALTIGGIALIALGAAMANILLVIAGLGLIGSAVAVAVNNGSAVEWAETLGLNTVFDYVVAALQLAGIALIAIGAAMGNIFMVIAGAVLLSSGIAADVIGQETLSDWWEALKLTSVQQWVSVALLLGGIALTAIGAATANIVMLLAGLGMIGFGVLVGTQNNNLADWVTTLGLEKAAGWVTAGLLIGGIALVVFGIMTANILMVLAGLGLLGAGIAVGVASGTFEDWLGTISGAFSSFANTVKSIFDGLWSGIKGIINSILDGIEWMANGVINGINFVIGALNNLNFTIPDWVPGIGGGNFGFNIPKLDSISIPRLAQGAVIPPNREFLAVLGDQKSGTNIETPLSTMVQAFKQALAESGGQNEAYLVLDDQVVGRIFYKLYNKESRRVGVRLSEVQR